MSKYIIIVICLFVPLGVFSQTNVVKTTAMKSNNYGVTYFLPKTKLVVDARVTKTTYKTGPYYRYAQKYLGVNELILEDRIEYSLDAVTVTTIGVPDRSQAYLIEFKARTTAPFAYLTEDGLLCTINAEYQPEQKQTKTIQPAEELRISAQSIFTEEYLQAGSVGKMAELSAKQIYRLRESRMDLLTGEAENMPRDGEAMKLVLQQLDAKEKALVEQFVGSITTEEQRYEIDLLPEDEINENILFRFSKHLGIVGADDLSGVPVYINVTPLERAVVTTNPKVLAQQEKTKQQPKGIIYSIPGKTRVEVFAGVERVYTNEFLMPQFGDTQILGPNIFDDKKAPVKVFFHPETGALKQVIQ